MRIAALVLFILVVCAGPLGCLPTGRVQIRDAGTGELLSARTGADGSLIVTLPPEVAEIARGGKQAAEGAATGNYGEVIVGIGVALGGLGALFGVHQRALHKPPPNGK